MPQAIPPGNERPLTAGETAIAQAVFGAALDPSGVRIRRDKWFPFQPVTTVMAPCGHLHFHPRSLLYRDDFGVAGPGLQALFVHELTHVWQTQLRGRWWLPLMRHPFCRYDYTLVPDRPLSRYGIEQQAEIVAHGWLATIGAAIPRDRPAELLLALLPVHQHRTR